MKCENDKEQITLWINNEMTEAERNAFELHLAECAECRQEVKAEQSIWNMMNEVAAPQPSADMPVRFQAMLEEYKGSLVKKRNPVTGFIEKLRQLWTLQPGMQLAYTIVLIVVGLGIGYIINRPSSTNNTQEIASLSEEMRDMKKMMMLSLLQNPSASERMRGVSFTSEITSETKSGNNEVIEALLSTLNTDPNVNVRLVTLEALTQYSDDAAVRTGLVQSIVQQDSPIMQAALADVMLKLKDKRSVKSFQKLLQQKDLDHSIRNKIEQTITGLI
ncbi:MAG: zf-HC2 domain-containing protein [Bacteroidota bacterium]